MAQQLTSQERARARKRIVSTTLFLIVLIVFGYMFYRMISNGNTLRDFCSAVKPGMTRDQLRSAAQATQLAERYRDDDPKADSAAVMVPGAYPPNQCYVEFDGDQVKSAVFVPYD